MAKRIITVENKLGRIGLKLGELKAVTQDVIDFFSEKLAVPTPKDIEIKVIIKPKPKERKKK